MTDKRLIFDLHCDTLTESCQRGVGLEDPGLQLSLANLPDWLGLCQCMAVFIPDTLRGEKAWQYFCDVHRHFLVQLERHPATLCRLLDLCATRGALERHPLAVILTVEGGALLAGKLERLDALHNLGVRMITLTWNGANEICGGAATTQGFTPFGREVVGRMEHLDMVVDVSHLSDAGFWELCDFAGRPFVASHSNCRAVCAHRRNLTDGMIREIIRRGGLAGINYYREFITESGKGTVEDLLRHIHHYLDLGGESILALGSDFDGADMPDYLPGVQKLEVLIAAMERSGIPRTVVDNILFENANRFFAGTIGGKGI